MFGSRLYKGVHWSFADQDCHHGHVSKTLPPKYLSDHGLLAQWSEKSQRRKIQAYRFKMDGSLMALKGF